MRFAFVHGEKAHHAVRRLCSVLQVTPSGYYAWAHRGPERATTGQRPVEGTHPGDHTASRGTYGSPRIHEQLRQDGVPVGRARVARLLQDMGLIGLPLKRHRCTTDSDHQRPVAPNVLARAFDAAHPNERWSTDITYVWTWEGWLYLAVVLDLFSRARGGLGYPAAPAGRVGARGAAHGAGAPSPGGRLATSLGSGLPVCGRRVSARAARPRDRLLHESEGRLLGQRHHGELLRDAQDRAHSPAAVADAARGQRRRGGVHRSFYNPYRLHSSLGYVSPKTVKGGTLGRLSVQHNQPVHFSQARSPVTSHPLR